MECAAMAAPPKQPTSIAAQVEAVLRRECATGDPV